MKRTLLASALTLSVAAGSVSAADLLFKPGEDKRFSWDSYEQLKKIDLKGEVITIMSPWSGNDRDNANNVIAYFEAATGAQVELSGSESFEQQIMIDVRAGSPPNIAAFPQPGLAAEMAAAGFLSPLGEDSSNWVKENYAAGESWVDLGTYKNKQGKEEFFGFFYKIDVKSLVWYVPENFEDAGYEVPETMEELKELTKQIAEDGDTPWCIGIASGGATGWPATDWVEDMMLRTQTPEDYDKWVTNELSFTDPKVIQAIEEFGWFVLNDDFVDGGARSVGASDFRESVKGLFSSPARCYLHRQASFIPVFFPDDVVVGEDADFFYLPAYQSKDLGKPVLGSGNLWAITNDSKGTRAFIDFLKTPIAHEIWMAQDGFLTPYREANTDTYADDTSRGMGEILLNATTFRFDGSDLMPGQIGAGAFWTGMVDYTGGKPAEEVAADIQRNWDALK